MSMNLNQLAVAIAVKEGGKKNLSIAQIKEVLRCFADVAYEVEDDTGFLVLCSKLYATAKKRHNSGQRRAKPRGHLSPK